MLAPVALHSRAQAQTITVLPASLGEIVSATTGVTTFSFAATGGTVTRVSGSGTRVSTGTTKIQVSVLCNVSYCGKGNTIVTVGAIGAPTGRAGALANFTFDQGTSTIKGGPSGSNPLTVTIGPIGTNSTVVFYAGADYPIGGDDSAGATGVARSGMYVTTTDSKGNSAKTQNSSASATVYRSMNLSQGSTLSFGRIVRPVSGTAVINLNAATGAVTATPAIALSSPSPTRASYTITAEGGSSVTISVPATFTLAGPASSSLPVTLAATTTGAVALGGTLGSGVTYAFGVGGSMTISSATQSGSYSGTFAVTVNYN